MLENSQVVDEGLSAIAALKCEKRNENKSDTETICTYFVVGVYLHKF